uniref:Uncharacterized protein n=1 Tax=Lactuca sativa TaxID=4236 RepID=A0A9R1V211_LACSA|nr:hypothetical protein LSAT_V11C700388080 [Lactuca sativa]
MYFLWWTRGVLPSLHRFLTHSASDLCYLPTTSPTTPVIPYFFFLSQFPVVRMEKLRDIIAAFQPMIPTFVKEVFFVFSRLFLFVIL